MKIPKTIKVGGFTWTIHENKDVATQGDIYGSTHHGSQKIFLDPDMTLEKREQTLLHEAMHAVWWQSGLGYRYKDNPKIEEEVISAVSMGMYQVLKDNDMLK